MNKIYNSAGAPGTRAAPSAMRILGENRASLPESEMEHRIDFIRRLFVVAITVGFASRIGSMEWFVAHRWPTRLEWHAIALLAVGLAAIIESWEGYFASIAERPQRTIARFIIDIMVAFAYLFLLLSSTYLPYFICVMTGIFLLYFCWNISLLIEYKEEFIGSPAQPNVVDKNSGESVLRQLALGLRDPSSSTYQMAITLYWTLYFLMICIMTLVIRKDMTSAVALVSVYGLAMYGMDKKKLFTIRTRSVLIAVAALFFAGTAAVI
jgi:hypothetical protein